MRHCLRLILAIGVLNLSFLTAQTHAPATPHQPAPWTKYCQPNGGFCFKYPSSWTMLGQVFNGNGVVVAPAQRDGREVSDEITVAMVVPPPEGDEQAIGLDGVIQQTTSGLRDSGQSFETLQRQSRTVDNMPAQMLKAKYQDKKSGRDWIEELVFIEGPDDEIYSVALKCAPQNFARLEPVFAGMLQSWMLPEPEPPADVPDEAAPPASAPPQKAPATVPQ